MKYAAGIAYALGLILIVGTTTAASFELTPWSAPIVLGVWLMVIAGAVLQATDEEDA